MSSLKKVPCVQVTSENIDQLWHEIVNSIEKCHIVALDLELTGLGPRHKLNAKQIDERYQAVVEAAKSRSILSLGLSLFTYEQIGSKSLSDNVSNEVNISDEDIKEEEEEDVKEDTKRASPMLVDSENVFAASKKWNFSAQIFNLICLCEQEYVVEPDTLKFLVGHGFDFNNQCSSGLLYHRGNDYEYEDRTKPNLRNLIDIIIAQKIPIVVHNGFIDLIFLYENFYAESPNDLQVFLADLSEMFPSGIYDTKYIADFHARLSRSYLEYLFYERQRFNLECIMKKMDGVSTSFPTPLVDSSYVEYRDLLTKFFSNTKGVDICRNYAYHGWCKNNNSCTKSHNIDYILDKKFKQKSKRSKKKMKLFKKMSDIIENENNEEEEDAEETNCFHSKQGAHRAGYDAFMTGYCFTMFLANFAKNNLDPKSPIIDANKLGITDLVNNIYLTGKDQPLKVIASSFVKPSNSHKNKITALRSLS